MSVPLCACLHSGQTDSSNFHNHASHTHALVFQIDSGHTNTHTHSQQNDVNLCLQVLGIVWTVPEGSRPGAVILRAKSFCSADDDALFQRFFLSSTATEIQNKIHKNVKFGLSANVSLFSLQKGFFLMSAHCLPFPQFLLHGCPSQLHRYHGSIKRGFQFPNDGENSAPRVHS